MLRYMHVKAAFLPTHLSTLARLLNVAGGIKYKYFEPVVYAAHCRFRNFRSVEIFTVSRENPPPPSPHFRSETAKISESIYAVLKPMQLLMWFASVDYLL